MNRLSAMYSFVRQKLQGDQARAPSTSDMRVGKEKYKSYKCMAVARNPKQALLT